MLTTTLKSLANLNSYLKKNSLKIVIKKTVTEVHNCELFQKYIVAFSYCVTMSHFRLRLKFITFA